MQFRLLIVFALAGGKAFAHIPSISSCTLDVAGSLLVSAALAPVADSAHVARAPEVCAGIGSENHWNRVHHLQPIPEAEANPFCRGVC
jgi:hypothetical protein